MSNLQTRSQTTTVWKDDRRIVGPIEDVPVHPLGDAVFHDANIAYIIVTDDGTKYRWMLSWYSRWTLEQFHMVQRTKDGITTEWESPPTLKTGVTARHSEVSYYRFYPNGAVDFRCGERLYKYSAKKNAVPIQGVQSVKNLLDYDGY